MKRAACLALLLPIQAWAWEEEPALAFIVAHSPLLQAQRAVVAAYQPPSLTRRVMEHTSFYVRAASGTSSTVSESGDTTTSSPLTVGIQVNIPLASPREQREFTQQALAEATRIDEVRGRALTDLAKLRELEAERAGKPSGLPWGNGWTFRKPKPLGWRSASRRATRARSKSSGRPRRNRTWKPPPPNAWICSWTPSAARWRTLPGNSGNRCWST